jgi:hypothetical protein
MGSSASTGKWHAVVIGVSEYANKTGLTASGPAMSAARFAEWLRNEFRHPRLEFGSLRVLLSPTEAEHDAAQAAAGGIDGPATRGPVEQELMAWADRCDRSNDVGLLYLAGHGTSMVAAGGYLLLADFGAPGAVLGRALSIDSVRDAMETKGAHANFFFIDACQETIDEQYETQDPQCIKPIDVVRGAPRRRQFYRAVYGAAPDQKAWTLPDEEAVEQGTVFSKALFQALRTAADWDKDGGFCVTIDRLIAEIADNVERGGSELHARYGRDIRGTSQASGTPGDLLFHVPERVPVRLEIELDPASAADTAQGKLYRYTDWRRAVLDRDVALQPQPAQVVVDSGKYKLQLSGPPPPGRIDQIDEHAALPGTERWKVVVAYLS